MAEITVGSDVAKIVMGNDTLWERTDPKTTWIELEDKGKSGVDFIGREYMNFDSSTGTASFMGVRVLPVLSGYKPGIYRNILELPKGYTFSSENPATLSIYESGGHHKSYSIHYDGRKISALIDSNYLAGSGTSYFSFHTPTDFSAPGSQQLFAYVHQCYSLKRTFNVIKED